MRDCTLTWENSPSHTHAAAGLTTQSLPVLGQPLQKPLKGCGGAFAQNEKTAAEPRTTPPTHNRELQYPTTQTPYYPLSQTGKAARGSQHATPRHRPLQKVRALEQHPAHHKRPNSWHAVTPVASLHMSPPMASLSLSLSHSLTHSLADSPFLASSTSPPPQPFPHPPHPSHTAHVEVALCAAPPLRPAAARPIRLSHPPSHIRPAAPVARLTMACPST